MAQKEESLSGTELFDAEGYAAGRINSDAPAHTVVRKQPVQLFDQQRRKILFYTHALTQGGAERVTAALASAFARHGDDVTLIVDHEMPDHGIGLADDVTLLVLNGGHSSQLRALVSVIKAMQPDCIVSALSSSNAKMAIAAFAAGMSKRHIMTWHGFPQAEKSFMSRLGYWMSPVAGRISAHSVCVSDALLKTMRARGIPESRSSRIYNPVDVVTDRIETRNVNIQKPVVMSAGRLAAVKDFPALLDAFARLPFPDARLIILGEGQERLRIENHALQLGISDRLHLPGHAHDMQPYFKLADVFVVSSLSESFSNVLVEALSYGLPVIATDCGGPREILEHGRYGQLVNCGDAAAMATAIERAIRQGEAGAEQRRERADYFNLTASVQQYHKLFDLIIARTQ
ncbi:MAG: glycosyltransferase [Beijerinckiaceae bacterium]